MDGKKKTTLLSIGVLLLFLSLTFFLLTRFGVLDFEKKGIEINSQEDIDKMLNAQIPATDKIMTPPLLEEYADGPEKSEAPISKNLEPEKIEQGDFRPAENSFQQREQYMQVGADSFEPREIMALNGRLVLWQISALDSSEHKIVFNDEKLSFLNNSFSKDNSISLRFNAPEAGDYSFYIDRPENSGVLKVLNE